MAIRRVKGLVWAAIRDGAPEFPKRRPRGTKAEGLRYQKLVGKALPRDAQEGFWFEFEDRNGYGVCQPDFLLPIPAKGAWAIIECKRTDCRDARVQLLELYLPVVGLALETPCMGVIVAKYTSAITDPGSIAANLDEVLSRADGRLPVVNWLGNGPI